MKWCLSTVKKAKVFVIIYQANENGKAIYKEEIAKQLPEYSYKTIATIIDEGIAKSFYISLDPVENKVSDKKIKNIRPSLEVITAFYNWNIDRISRITDIIKSTLPKNRDLNIRDSQEFIKIAQRVREGLKSGHEDDVL